MESKPLILQSGSSSFCGDFSFGEIPWLRTKYAASIKIHCMTTLLDSFKPPSKYALLQGKNVPKLPNSSGSHCN